MARHVRDLTAKLDVPLGVVLEGGYAPASLAESVRATLAGTRRSAAGAIGGAGGDVDCPRRRADRALLAVVRT
jgi:acetoin utilization deacetylase AcuC-like enzyme